MITSKQIINIIEKWSNTIKAKNTNIYIYENPTSSDIIELIKNSNYKTSVEIRFICNSKNQTVYVWDAYLATHFDVASHLNLGSITSSSHLLCGMCKVVNGRLQSTEIYLVNGSPSDEKYNLLFSVLEYNWLFVDKYIRGINDYLKRNKEEYTRWYNAIEKFKRLSKDRK